MNLNITYDQSTLKAAPAAFFTAVNYVANLYDERFTDNVTVNIEVGYGDFPLDGSLVQPLAESQANNDTVAYSQVRPVLINEGAPGLSTLPSTSPIAGDLMLTTAQEKVLGLIGASSALDGWIGIASNATLQHFSGEAWSFSPTATPSSTQYYIVGALEHEISEVMGRVSDLTTPSQYSVMDLYRYQAPGVRQTGGGDPSYFSIDGGQTNLASWNNIQITSGDLGDWAPNAGPSGVFTYAGADAFLNNSPAGQINALTPTDVTLMAAIGWQVAPVPIAQNVNVAVNASIGAGQLIASIPNPLGDSITEYGFWDGGTGNGHFALNGVAQPDGQWINVAASTVGAMQYVGGSSPGSETLYIDVYDATTGTWSASSALTATTLSSGLLATLSLNQQTELIYIGYFNRSADGSGFAFWEGQDASAQAGGQSAAVALTNIANSFTPQAETVAIYPFLANSNPNYSDPTVLAGLTTFVENVYTNLFAHAADSGGLAYWLAQIENGAVGLGAAVLAIANGAQGSDATILQNKITVALDFTALTTAANLPVNATFLAEARSVLSGVDSLSLNDASVAAAEATIGPWIASHPQGALVAVVGSAPAPPELA
jgi:hypothetical protein